MRIDVGELRKKITELEIYYNNYWAYESGVMNDFVEDLEKYLDKVELEHTIKVWDLIWVSDYSYDDALHTYVNNETVKFYFTWWISSTWLHIVRSVYEYTENGYQKEIYETYAYISKPMFK